MSTDGDPTPTTHRPTPGHVPDPHRYWNGMGWLRWTGTTWTPEQTTTPGGATPAPVGTPSRSSRTGWIFGIAFVLLAVVGTVVGLVVTSGGGSHPSSGGSRHAQGGASNAHPAITSPAQVCELEVLAGIDIIQTTDGDFGAGVYRVQQAIGSRTPVYLLIGQEASQYGVSIGEVGVNAAKAKIGGTVRSACTQAGNPVLDRGELSGLIDIAFGDDADTLGRIKYFG